MVAVLGYSRDEILEAVKEMYTSVATIPDAHFHFPVGPSGLAATGYPDDLVADLPSAARESFAGVGCPFRAGDIHPGERVLDIGAGAGTDSLIAAQKVEPTGRVYALDVTPAMTAKLTRTASEAGFDNIEVLEGSAENIPLEDASVDMIISNGVLNLVPDKRRAMREKFRVLQPGGRVQLADIVIKRPVTPDCLGDPKLWAECVVGATVDEDYLEMFRDAGFVDVEIVDRRDYFAHSPSTETREVARSFEASAIELRMRRATTAPSLSTVFIRRANPRRLARAIGRRGLWGVVALVAALAACYGTLAALLGLGALGATVVLNEGVWAAAIVALTLLTAAFVAAGLRKHTHPFPSLLAGAGAVLVVYVFTIAYDGLLEMAGFALLAAGVVWDYRIRRYAGAPRVRAHAAEHATDPEPYTNPKAERSQI